MTPYELMDQIGQAEQANDLETLLELKKLFVPVKTKPKQPFSGPRLRFAKNSGIDQSTESDAVTGTANALSRAIRRVKYNRKLLFGYRGPRIVAEGDSWFEYPFILDDILDELMSDYAVYSLAAGGDLLTNMSTNDEFSATIVRERPQFFLLSGGGNDMLGAGSFINFLKTYVAGMTAAEVLDRSQFDPFFDTMMATMSDCVNRALALSPNLVVLLHGYDYALPQAGGDWLGKPLASKGVPAALWSDVVRIIIDEFNAHQIALANNSGGRVIHIDCRGVVGPDPSVDWYDELHPRNPGFARVAAKFKAQLTTLSSATTTREVIPVLRIPPLSLGRNAGAGSIINAVSAFATQRFTEGNNTDEAIVGGSPFIPHTAPTVAPKLGGTSGCATLDAWRRSMSAEDIVAYGHYAQLMEDIKAGRTNAEEMNELVNRQEMLDRTDLFSLERIIGDSNMYQTNYLARGMRAAKAVGRVGVVNRFDMQLGLGTGFLVAPGLLLTNHHVLEDASLYQNSHVLFDYEYDADNHLMATERFGFTGEIYYSNKELDFAFISVAPVGQNGHALSEFGHLRLVPDSGKAVRGEYVSIIQHPSGQPKQLALRDSQIIGRMKQYIYYTTDTNPGSSGSPVINDDWYPVALHHRSVPDYYTPCKYVANRGIRISAICEHLKTQAASDPKAKAVLDKLEASLGGSTVSSRVVPEANDASSAHSEILIEPFHEEITVPRKGYDASFLGISVPMPKVKPQHAAVTAKKLDGSGSILDYEHFSLVMHKERRLAMFTASNVDVTPARRKPDPTKRYDRKSLNGFPPPGTSPNAVIFEKWFEDPRIASTDQLPDRFFENDRGAFDKGHICRRDDVAWGDTYRELRRGNGDTFHTTNCSPQVKGFNRSTTLAEWDDLEDLVFDAAKTERLCVFAGPVLDPDDKRFRGKDNSGDVHVQIPVKYWKVVVAKKDNAIQSFAFLLEQNLTGVRLEFAVDDDWKQRMISITELEGLVRFLRFPAVVRNGDQHV